MLDKFLENKKLQIIVGSIAVVLLIIGAIVYAKAFSSNTNFEQNEVLITIPTHADYTTASQIIKPYIDDFEGFESIAKQRNYIQNIKAGQFLLKKGMGNYKLISALRHNIPVKLAFNNQERIEDLVARVGTQIEADSTKLMKSITDTVFLKKNGFTKANVLTMFIPNTYEIYWNTDADKFRDKMLAEFRTFWAKKRIQQAKIQNLTPIEATILASIVHKETVKKDERPKVAAVYLNRLKIAMPLQADPTIIFAVKKNANDFTQIIKRVLPKDLTINSPYNTYINLGLPPGPVAMPDITALEAVLKPDKNDYLFFCASVERFGYHEFATTFAQHVVIANKYRDWINKQGVKR